MQTQRARVHPSKARRRVSLKNAGRKYGESGGESDFVWWVRHRMSEIHPAPAWEETVGFRIWIWERMAASDLTDYGRPIKVFCANLLRFGVTVQVVDGTLRIGGKTGNLSPTYREEIIKRKEQLIELLSIEPPELLAPYFGRLLSLPELKEALWLAETHSIKVEACPCNGGWLVFMK